MPQLLVTPYSCLFDAIDQYRPSHIVSLLSPAQRVSAPADFDARRHLRPGLDEVSAPWAAEHLPGREEIGRPLEFSRDWGMRARFLTHCRAGTSRAMASASTVLADL